MAIKFLSGLDLEVTSSVLKTDANGVIIAAVAGTDYAAASHTHSYLPLAGGTMTGDVTFNDNVKASFGASDDLEIYHDASNSYITNATGEIFIKGADDLSIQDTDGTNRAIFQANAQKLYYDGSLKFETTSTGVAITGNLDSPQISVNDYISHNGDSNTYFGFPTADTINLTTAGAERMRITSAGNVGIGTVSPLGRLQVNEYTVASQGNQSLHGELSVFANSGDESLFLGVKNAAYPNRGWSFNPVSYGVNSSLQIKEHGSTAVRMTIQSGGNVGIGTASPTDKLDVAGAIRLTSNISFSSSKAGRIYKASNHGLAIQGVTGTENDFAMFTPTGALKIIVPTGTQDLVLNPSNGNVGIGTTTPGTTLDVSGVITATSGTSTQWNAAHTYSQVGHLPLAGGTLSGDVTFTGATHHIMWDKSANALEFWDNAKLTFGDPGGTPDLSIYHDGSNSYIKDTGTGNLEIRSNFFKVKSTVAEDMIWAQENAGVSLFHNNILKLSTTSTGVTVAGVVTSTGLQVNGATYLDVMAGHQVEGTIRIGRYDVNTSRYHDIKSYVSSTAASNYLKFSIHNGTENTVADVLTLKGDLSARFAGDVVVTGDLIVDGTTTTINTATVEVEDNILQLNTTQASPDTATAATSGISIYRGDGVTQASLIFDDADDTWDLTNNLVVAGPVTTGGDLTVGGTGGIFIPEYIYHRGDTNTFLGFPSNNDTIVFATNGSTALTLDASNTATFAGNVISNAIVQANGFRTTSGSTDYSLLTRNSSNTAVYIQQAGSGDILDVRYGSQAAGQGTSAFAVNSSGNATFAGDVGLGGTGLYTTSASLNIDGTGLAIKNDTSGSSNNWSIIKNSDTASSSNIEFITGAGTSLTLNHDTSATFSGDVAISSTMPKLTFTDLQQDDWRIMNDNGDFRFTNIDGSGHALILATNNNATFAGSLISANSGSYFRIQNAAGNSTYPTYSFQDDSNTGMMSSSTDSLSFVTGGTQALILDSSQNATFAGNISMTGTRHIGADDNFYVGGATSGTDHTFIGDSGRNVTIYNGATFTVASGASTFGGNATFSGSISGNGKFIIANNGTATWGAANDYGQLSWDTGYALIRGQSGKGIKLQTNSSSTALTLDTSQNATFAGNITTTGNINAGNVYVSGSNIGVGGAAANPTYGSVVNKIDMNSGVDSLVIMRGSTGSTEYGLYAYNNEFFITPTNVNNWWVSPEFKLSGGNATFSGNIASQTANFADNVYMLGGQLYLGASGSSTDDSYRLYAASGQFILASRESGTWTTRFDIDTSGNATFAGTVTAAVIGVDSLTFNGTEIDSSGSLEIDAAADITIDAGGGDIILSDDGTIFGTFSKSGNDLQLRSRISDGDLLLRGVDGGVTIDALKLDMSAGGAATFAGKLGIGITPVELLDIQSASGDARIRLDAPSGSDTEVKFFNAGVAQYTIGHDDATDNFVIGGANVDAPLVSVGKTGNATFAGDVSIEDNLYLTDSGTVRGKIQLNSSDRDDLDIKAVSLGSNMKFFTVDTERMRIDSSGNVGIGVTAPIAKLHIVSDDTTASAIKTLVLGGGTTVDGNGQYIQFSSSSNDTLGSQIAGTRVGTGASSDLRFSTTSGTSAVTERMRIGHGGNVGIGPNALGTPGGDRLHIDGTLRVGPFFSTSDRDHIKLYPHGTDSKIISPNERFHIENLSGDIILNAGGNVGIGTTSPTQKLHVDGHALISAEKYYYVAGTGAGVGSDASGNLILRQNSTSLMTTSGNNATFAGNLEVQGADVTITANVIHAGDVDTYFGFNANNSWRVVTGGSERFKVTSDVHVTGSTDFAIPAGRKLYLDGQSSTYITESSDGVIDFYGDGVQLLTAKQNGTQSEVVVNEGSGDVDFRVEANTNSHAFFVEAEGAGKVGIGTTAPDFELDVAGNIGMDNKLYHNGDHNTYIGFEHDNIKLRTGGVDAITVNSSQNVGIGTTGPAYKLDVDGDVQINETLIAKAGADLILQARSSQVVGINSNGARTMTLNASNNVGIGTTNPLNKLFVSASTAGDYAGFIENTNSTNGYGLVARTAHTGTSAYAFAARAASTDIFVVRGDGNVGIGTTSPLQLLHVNGASDGNSIYTAMLQNTGTAPNTASKLLFVQGGSTIRGAVIGGLQEATAGSPTSMVFETSAAYANPSERMRITSAGNVGIGTTSPGIKLDVNSGGSDSVARFTSTDARARILISDNNDISYFGTYIGTTFLGPDDTPSGNTINVLSNGNVGIGVTVPTAKLDVRGTGNFLGTAASGAPLVTIENNSGSTATSYGLLVKGGGNSSSGKTFEVRDDSGNTDLIVKGNGNVGIGTSSPAQKLDVQGTILVNNEIQFVDANMRIFRSSNDMRLRTGGSDRIAIDSTGDVGIGTTAPGAKLQVGTRGTSSALTVPVTDGILFDFYNVGSPYTRHASIISQAGDASESVLDFWTKAASGTNSQKMTILGNGSVGMGVTAPLANLDISNVAGTTYQQWSYDNPGANNYNLTLSETVTAGNVRFVFDQKNAGTQYSDVLVFNQGKIGVGTDEPQAKLHVSGRVYQDGLGNSTFFGDNAGAVDDLSTNVNAYFGYGAGKSSVTGASNAAFGYATLYNNTASNNTAVGRSAMENNTTGTGNTAIGMESMRVNTTASFSTANGYRSLYSNTTGTENSAFGYEALRNTTTAGYNSAFGTQALRSSTTGYKNVAVGATSMYANTTGYANTATGYLSLRYNTTGHSNTAVGFQALRANTTASYNTAVGRDALVSNTTGTNNTATGYQSLKSNTTGDANTATGYKAIYTNTTGHSNTVAGYLALYTNTTGALNTATGSEALRFNTTGNYNTADGYSALRANTTGGYNTATGYSALYSNTTGEYNTASGMQSLRSNTTGVQNVAIGYESMYTNISGNYSVGVGFRALKANTASQGTGVGYEALLSNTSGANNVAIGFEALKLNTTGADNTAIGHQAGNSESTATKCVFIGKGADAGGTGTSNQIVIGWGAEGNGSNTVTLGDSNTTEGVFAYGAYQEISDQSVKENVVTIGNALSKVKAMRGVTYNKIGRETTKVGVIAQEMELVLPEVVAEGSGGLKSVAYGNIVAVLIEAMKEQQTQIDNLQQQINNL